MEDFIPVTVEREIRRVREATDAFVTRVHPGYFALRRIPGWIALPFEAAMHFTDAQSQRLLQALNRAGCSALWAIALEPLGGAPEVYSLHPTEAALRAFNRTFGTDNFVLLASDRSCAVICTSDDFFVIAGEPRFVVDAAGAPIEQALAEFQAYGSAPFWKDVSRRFFRSVLHAIRDEYPSASPGTWVAFPMASEVDAPVPPATK